MKRGKFLQYLRKYNCMVKREGKKHTLVVNISNGIMETVPRHREIDNILVKKICRRLKIPVPFP